MARINLNDAVADLHPAPPPCFLNRLEWVEYLKSAAAVQNHKGEPRVILVVKGEPAFNLGFDYCCDCTQIKSFEMMRVDRCKPGFLQSDDQTTGN